jgi:hypothetical protein
MAKSCVKNGLGRVLGNAKRRHDAKDLHLV